MEFTDLIKQLAMGMPGTELSPEEAAKILANPPKADVCPMLLLESCREAHTVLDMVELAHGRKTYARFEDLPKKRQAFIRDIIVEIHSNKLRKPKSAEDEYRLGLILAAARRAAQCHRHGEHA